MKKRVRFLGAVQSLRIWRKHKILSKTFLASCTSNPSFYKDFRVVDSMVRRISRLAKALKWKIYHFLVCFFCASVDVERFLKTRFRPWIHQPSESFGLTLAMETTFNSNFWLKNSEISTLLGSSPVLRHNNACGWNVWLAKRLPKL